MTRKTSKRKSAALRREEVIAGYSRLAFGTCNDALKLLFCDGTPGDDALAGLDIFNVSEIKRPKGGGMELKFYDRFEALQGLLDIGGLTEVPDGVKAFYEAIERSVDNA